MKQLLKKRHLSKPVCLLFAAALALLLSSAAVQSFRFHHFTKTLFQEEMKNDSLSMHYTLAHPQDYGIAPDHVTLLPYSRELEKEQEKRLADHSKTADSIHPLFWKKESRQLLSLLQEQLALSGQETGFPYYAEPLSPSSGVPTNLPVLLAEYTFRSRQDVDNYLTLLSQIPTYLDGLAVYEAEKAQAGLFMSDSCADKVINQCYSIMDSQKLMKDTHFLNTTFSERLQPLIDRQLLTREEADSYEKQNHILLLEKVMPAYESLGDKVLALKGSGKEEMGLAQFPDGAAYYTFLLKDTTGCNRSITDIKALLAAQLKKDTEALTALAHQSPALLSTSLDSVFPQMSSEEYLTDLQKRMSADFPPFPQTGITPSYTVKQVSKSLEDYCSPAFYLTPPIDDISENSIYINGKDNPDALELYTTLAHEGYPGHLYQTVYYQLYQQKEGINPARNLLHCGGYSEGWALYVEMHAYDYAKELLKEKNASANAQNPAGAQTLSDAQNPANAQTLSDAQNLIDALRLNRSIQLCMYSLLDIAIHYDGASKEAVTKYLRDFGVRDDSTASDIYDYIAEEPANYPKYYVGYLEFEMLRETAQQKWGTRYSNILFHRFLLETGPCPFHVLWEQLE